MTGAVSPARGGYPGALGVAVALIVSAVPVRGVATDARQRVRGPIAPLADPFIVRYGDWYYLTDTGNGGLIAMYRARTIGALREATPTTERTRRVVDLFLGCGLRHSSCCRALAHRIGFSLCHGLSGRHEREPSHLHPRESQQRPTWALRLAGSTAPITRVNQSWIEGHIAYSPVFASSTP